MDKKTDEPRYVGTNWDRVKVEERNGARGSTARKVITHGTHKIDAAELIAEAVAKLRQGFEVRFTDGRGDDAIRLYPCVAKGTDHMESTARTMGAFKSALNDKTVALRGPDGKKAKAVRPVEDDAEDEPQGVTPDIIVTCEVCGHRQRVGRKR